MMKKNSGFSYVLVVAFLGCFSAAVFSGCDEKKFDPPILGPAAGSIPVGGGEDQQVTLFASPSATIIASGSETAEVSIIARVQSSLGQAVPDDVLVIWTATVGTLSDTSSPTESGVATTSLEFPEQYAGCSTVTAMSGDDRESIRVCVERESESFLLKASDDDVNAFENVKMTATVTTDGHPQQGVLVAFEVYSSESDIFGQMFVPTDYATLNPSAAVTDSSGKASVTFEGQNYSDEAQMVLVYAYTDDGRTAVLQIRVRANPNP